MIVKKEVHLVAIPRSLKEFKAGIIVQLKNTKQFGTIRRESLRGKFARRNLRHTFNAISLYITDNGPITATKEVIFTLKDGEKVIAYPDDLMGHEIAAVDPILMHQSKIMESWIRIGSEVVPQFKFKDISPKVLSTILSKGGKLWLDTYDDEGTSTSYPLYYGSPVLHLT